MQIVCVADGGYIFMVPKWNIRCKDLLRKCAVDLLSYANDKVNES